MGEARSPLVRTTHQKTKQQSGRRPKEEKNERKWSWVFLSLKDREPSHLGNALW